MAVVPAARSLGRASRPIPVLKLVENGAHFLVQGNRPSARYNVYGSQQRHLVNVPVLRHTDTIGCSLVFGSLNVRSLSPGKLDNLFIDVNDRSIDILLLCETWHDADSVVICRLRTDGYQVVERARPRRLEATMKSNHDGVAIIAAAGLRLTAVSIGCSPSTFECVAARVTSGTSSCLIVVIYRPGSSAVTSAFFTELTGILDRLSTFTDPLVITGDMNIHLERTSDPDTVTFIELLAGYGLVQQVKESTR